jgi:Zn finger protein HypA/HybF involved in hydrogenase expression
MKDIAILIRGEEPYYEHHRNIETREELDDILCSYEEEGIKFEVSGEWGDFETPYQCTECEWKGIEENLGYCFDNGLTLLCPECDSEEVEVVNGGK